LSKRKQDRLEADPEVKVRLSVYALCFQKGFFNPAGARELVLFASVPESSEIFSSVKRDDGGLPCSRFGCAGGVAGKERLASIVTSMM